jgi:hypothetical protein
MLRKSESVLWQNIQIDPRRGRGRIESGVYFMDEDSITPEDLQRVAPDLQKFREILAEKLSRLANDVNDDPELREVTQKIRDGGVHIAMALNFGIDNRKVEAVPRRYKERVKNGKVVHGVITRSDRKFFRELKISFDDKTRPPG